MKFKALSFSKKAFISLVLVILAATPFLVSGNEQQLYVDTNNTTGTEDGSSAHPYRSIGEAFDHVKGSATVHIADGRYKENVTVPKHVTVVGNSKDNGRVVIESRNDNRPAVTMKHDTEMSYVTTEGGKYGVDILEDSAVHLYDCVISKADRDGIYIQSASKDKKYRALLDTIEIRKSGRAGIFAEERFTVVLNSNIHDNKSDGADMAAGSQSWFEDTKFSKNGGSGAKFVLDGASVFGKKNTFRDNKREGIEVDSFGVTGNIGLSKSKIYHNRRFGVARVARNNHSFGNWGGLSLDAADYNSNGFGNVSSIQIGF